MTERVVFTAQQAADYIGISRTTMYQWLAKKIIPYENLGPDQTSKRIIRIRKKDVDAYLDNRYVIKQNNVKKLPEGVRHGYSLKKGAA